MNRIRLLACAAAIVALTLTAASAQDFRSQNSQRAGPQRGSHQGTPGEFDFYVLSLSWSPSFCESGGGGRSKNEQCEAGRPYAFVVHGLWPQYERGYPEKCVQPAPWIDKKLIRTMLDLMPAWGLVIHEWQAHGTCSGLDAERYFATVRTARAKVNIPERFVRLNGYVTLAPSEVEEAFIAANPGLANDMIAVTCSQRYLSEVRICMNKELAFRPCPETDRRACRNPQVVMPPVRGG